VQSPSHVSHLGGKKVQEYHFSRKARGRGTGPTRNRAIDVKKRNVFSHSRQKKPTDCLDEEDQEKNSEVLPIEPGEGPARRGKGKAYKGDRNKDTELLKKCVDFLG